MPFRKASPWRSFGKGCFTSRSLMSSPTFIFVAATLAARPAVVVNQVIWLRNRLVVEQVFVFRRRVPDPVRNLVVAHQEEGLVANVENRPPKNWRSSMYYRYWMHNISDQHVPAHYGIRTQRWKLMYYYSKPLE